MPEGDTIHYAAMRVRAALLGKVPEEILTPHPRHRMDRWPERLAGLAVNVGRGERQAPAHALRGRAHAAFPSAHGRLLGGLPRRPALAAGTETGLAGDAQRGRRGGPVRRAGAGAYERGPLAQRSPPCRPRPRRDRPRASIGRPSCAGSGKTIRPGRSAMPCSINARSPASATCGRPRPASRRQSIRGGRPARSPTSRRWPWSTSPASTWPAPPVRAS